MGREGIELLAATSPVKGACFTDRREEHDPILKSAQGRIRTCNHLGLNQVAQPMAYLSRIIFEIEIFWFDQGTTKSSPGRTRTADRLYVKQLPYQLGHRTITFLVSFFFNSGSRGTRTHKRVTVTCFQDRVLIQPVGFRSTRAKAKQMVHETDGPIFVAT